ncbi:hypothetical protein [Psychroserpens sp. SPM9]|uniref:hypothetical protein n=1 Tax=Psychroserpens sp. SPM9 TaxID=2975598 RepID=UPI0021A764CF|nr:hypothetical protein [Psychroserpens sp. SPM9]MDG5490724.1 hypothetical protein [Psychroserpens sp. SPM9]
MSINNRRLSACVGIALSGGLQIKGIKFTSWKHEFNIKAVHFEYLEDGIKINGNKKHHISHHRSFKTDQQVYYAAKVKNNGEIEGIWVNNESSTIILKNWFETFDLRAIVKIITQDGFQYELLSSPIFWPQIEAAANTDLLLDGTWRGDVECLIANILIYAAVCKMPEIANDPPTHFIPEGLVEKLAFESKIRRDYQNRQEEELDKDILFDVSKMEESENIIKL